MRSRQPELKQQCPIFVGIQVHELRAESTGQHDLWGVIDSGEVQLFCQHELGPHISRTSAGT
eukprot:1159115-Pelagomonas_calceolata.AAC.8